MRSVKSTRGRRAEETVAAVGVRRLCRGTVKKQTGRRYFGDEPGTP